MALNSFITHIKQIGLPLSNQFEVIVPVIDGATNAKSETVSMICHSASLPGHNVMTNEIRIFGEPTERPYGISYLPVSLTFYLDNDMTALRYFNAWSDLVVNRNSRELGYYDEYTREVEIAVLDRQGKTLERYKLYEAYPKTVSEISLDYSSRNVSSVVVQLVYKWWEVTNQDNKVNNKPEEVSSASFPENGFESVMPGVESVGSQTGATLPGQGSFVNPSTPGFFGQESSINGVGQNLLTDSSRSLDLANNMFGMSTVQAPGNIATGADLVSLTGSLSSGFTQLGNGVSGIGQGFEFAAIKDNFVAASNNIAVDTGRLSSIIKNLGGNTQEINSSVAEMMRTSGNIQSATSSVNDLIPYIESLSSSMSNIGSNVNNSIPRMRGTTPLFDSAAGVGFNYIGQTFSNSGSILSSVATSLRK